MTKVTEVAAGSGYIVGPPTFDGKPVIGDIKGLDRGIIVTVAGGGGTNQPKENCPAIGANIIQAVSLAFYWGDLYIGVGESLVNGAESHGGWVRRVDQEDLEITTCAGGVDGNKVNDGPATEAKFRNVHHLAFDNSGNLYIAEAYGLRKVSKGMISTLKSPVVFAPQGLAFDSEGSLYVSYGHDKIAKGSDSYANTVFRITDPAGVNPAFTHFAGGGEPSDKIGDHGPAVQSMLEWPMALAFDSAGNLYIAERRGRIRKVSAEPNPLITTVAGGGNPKDGIGDNLPATQANIKNPQGIAFDSAGNLYITDGRREWNEPPARVRMVAASNQVITTVAGGGNPKDGIGDKLPATQAAIYEPTDVAVDAEDNLFISEGGLLGPCRVRMVVRSPHVPSTLDHLEAVGTTSLQADQGQPFDRVLEVKATKAGHRVAGVPVTFTISDPQGTGTHFEGSGNVVSKSATTDADGIATSPKVIAGAKAGTVTVTATAVDDNPAKTPYSVTFTLTVKQAEVVITIDSLTATGSLTQDAEPNQEFAKALEVKATKAGHPVAGVPVTFTISDPDKTGTHFQGSGKPISKTATTDADGIATAPSVVAGATPGTVTVTATATDGTTPHTVTFTLTVKKAAIPVKLDTLTATGPLTQEGEPGKPFPNAVEVKATKAGHPVAGVQVTFTISDPKGTGTHFQGSGSPLSKTATTDADGIATAPSVVAGATTGTVTVTATAMDGTTPYTVTFTLTVKKAATVVLQRVSPETPEAAPGKPFAALTVKATRDGQPVAGSTVTFTISDPNKTGSQFPGAAATCTATTDPQGIATAATLTAGMTSGSFTVTATMDGAPAPVTFEPHVAPQHQEPAVDAIDGNDTGKGTAKTNETFPNPLKVIARKAGSPVPGATVEFVIDSPDPTGSYFLVDGHQQQSCRKVTGNDGGCEADPLHAGKEPGTFTVTRHQPSTAATPSLWKGTVNK
ncbi:hypothetical protein AB0L88_09035 [Saccharopolyspora shandongensis]|uniref:hypothetical protein n=1 Tax=Saccharopolyspora shandongensis TaxID=418495 RepID=UPI003415C709